MARAGPSRPGPPQAGPSNRRGRAPVEDSSSGEEDVAVPGSAGNGPASEVVEKIRKKVGPATYDQKVKDFARLALFHQQKGSALKRDEITKKILPGVGTTGFPALFISTNLLLSSLGMKLHELRGKKAADAAGGDEAAEVNGAGAGGRRKRRRADGDEDEDAADRDAAAPAPKKRAPTGSKSYTLLSTLPPALLPFLNQPTSIPIPRTEPTVWARSGGGGGEGRELDCGAILDWQKGDLGGVGGMGLLNVVLALILVHGRAVGDLRLKKLLLDQLNISPETHLPFTSRDSTLPIPTLESCLKGWVKMGYLDMVKLSINGATDTQDIEWRWGPRADAEMGERGVAELIADVYDTREESDEDEPVAEARTRSTQAGRVPANPEERRARKRDKFVERVEKAAGGKLEGTAA